MLSDSFDTLPTVTTTTNSTIISQLLNSTFDTKTAITALYLWLLFGFLSQMISCDFFEWSNNIWFRHFIGIISFFFLFTVIDTSNKTSIGIIWLKTLIVYGVFLLMVKSKWYFSLPVLFLLMLDQTLRSHYRFLQANNPKDASLESINTSRTYLSILIYSLIIIGFIAYGIRQYREFGTNFSWIKLLFHYGCRTKYNIR